MLEAEGFSTHSFEPARIETSRQIDQKIARHWPAITTSEQPHHRLFRFLIKGLLITCQQRRWEFMRALFHPKPLTEARELDRFLTDSPFRNVHLITHSAGGISATHVAAHPKVRSICCLGYPFRHPHRRPESYRTRHLARIARPLLIIQGMDDEYGPASTELMAMLPPHAQIIALDCDHEYAGIDHADFAQLLTAIRSLIAP